MIEPQQRGLPEALCCPRHMPIVRSTCKILAGHQCPGTPVPLTRVQGVLNVHDHLRSIVTGPAPRKHHSQYMNSSGAVALDTLVCSHECLDWGIRSEARKIHKHHACTGYNIGKTGCWIDELHKRLQKVPCIRLTLPAYLSTGCKFINL